MICERCSGTGFEILVRDGREYAQACACREQSQAGGEDVFLSRSRIPPRYEHCTFDNFAPITPSQRSALEGAQKYCTGFPYLQQEDEGLGLLFTGGNGVGKTHLAVAVLRQLVDEKGASGQFWDFHELIREIKRSYDKETRTTEVQVLEPVVEAGILVLDDLGAWKMTDWMNDTLFYILNSRYIAKRTTIITTNYEDVDREKALAADPLARKEYLVERIGLRLRSRLMEMCVVVPVAGSDMRRSSRQELNRLIAGGASVGRQ